MRVSKKLLEISASNINHFTKHKVKIFFGCGVYLTIDGEEFCKQIGENEFTGISNKKAYEIMHEYFEEVVKNAIKSENQRS